VRFSLWEKGWGRGLWPRLTQAHPFPLSQREMGTTSPIISNRFDWAAGQGFFTCGVLGFIFGLPANIGIGALERAGKVFGSSLAADITIDAGRVDVEGAVTVLLHFVVWVRHESADYADFTE